MADPETIRERIRDIAQRRSNVSIEEIEWVVNQLARFYSVKVRDARHGRLFRVGNQRFMINYHNPGNKQAKAYSVDDFADAMWELGWYQG